MYVFLLIFWAGIFLLTFSDRYDLKARAEAFAGSLKEKSRKGFLVRYAGRIKTSAASRKMMTEISDCLSFVKNIIMTGRSSGISSQMLLEDLSDISELLSPVFLDMARFMSMNEKNLAVQRMKSAAGGGIAEDVGRFLVGWEELPPEDLLDTVNMYIDTIREDQKTKKRRRDELVSDMIYIPVVLNCMAVLLNFIFVAFFIEQREAFSVLF